MCCYIFFLVVCSYQVSLSEDDNRNKSLPTNWTSMLTGKNKGSLVNTPSIAYYIEGDGVTTGAGNAFVINETTGEIYVVRPLDRDPPHGRAQWHLMAYARNLSALPGSNVLGYADVVVHLRDINDNIPTFERPVYEASVVENCNEHKIIQIHANDADEDNNAQIVYSIERNQVDDFCGRAMFEINSHTGWISTGPGCCLDREKQDNYTLQVAATDGGKLKVSVLYV